MSNKFSIINTIDFNMLDKEIELYSMQDLEKRPYIFMNDDTVDAIERFVCVNNGSKNTKVNTGFIGRYNGCKVFVDNTLKFGEVEIR